MKVIGSRTRPAYQKFGFLLDAVPVRARRRTAASASAF